MDRGIPLLDDPGKKPMRTCPRTHVYNCIRFAILAEATGGIEAGGWALGLDICFGVPGGVLGRYLEESRVFFVDVYRASRN